MHKEEKMCSSILKKASSVFYGSLSMSLERSKYSHIDFSFVRCSLSKNSGRIRLFFSPLKKEEENGILNFLNSIKKKFRFALRESLKFRNMPEIDFEADKNIDYMINMRNLLEDGHSDIQ